MSDVHKEQKEFINILLNNKGTASTWADRGPDKQFFDPQYHQILAAIKYAAFNSSVLTKKTFMKFLESNIQNKMEIAAQENLFDKISILYTKTDDYNVLRENIVENHVNKKAIEYIDKWHQSVKNKSNKMSALKSLKSNLEELTEMGSGGNVKPVIFESISEYAPTALSVLEKKKDAADEDDDIVKTGISEVDNSIVTGIAPGTMTLFGADVGNYKCISGDSTLYLADGGTMPVRELVKINKNSKKLPKLLSLNEKTGKIIKQPIKHVLSNGIKKTYKVKTQSGFETMITDNHPLLTINGWEKLSELSVGSKIGIIGKDKFGRKVVWDEIVSIEFYKKEETYDIEMPVHHNFVLDGIITHNTTMMLNVALNIWENGHNVLFVPLEMPRELLYWKIMSRQAQVPFDHILKPKQFLTEEDYGKIKDTTIKIQNHKGASFYIMEKLDGHTTVSNILREIEKRIDVFQPRAVVVDYIGILSPDPGMKNERDDVKIGLMLKGLRQAGKPMALTDKGFGTISGAQIGRDALKRIRRLGVNKTSFHSEDLRGSHDYSADADNIFAQMKDPAQPNNRLLLFHLKTRYGKPIFSNGESKVSLYVQPNISYIRDLNNSWVTNSQDDILGKVEGDLGDPLSFDDDDDDLNFDDPKGNQIIADLSPEDEAALSELNKLDIDDFDTI